MSLDRKTLRLIKAVIQSSTSDFSTLVKLAELDPAKDFIGADLSHVDFGGADLSVYKFDHADLNYTKSSSPPIKHRLDLSVSQGVQGEPVAQPLRPYQARIYEAAIQRLNEGQPALFLTPTGIGKSRIVIELLKNERQRVRRQYSHVIAPSLAAVQQFSSHLKDAIPWLPYTTNYSEFLGAKGHYKVLIETQSAVAQRRKVRGGTKIIFTLSVCLDADRFVIDPDAIDYEEAEKMIGFGSIVASELNGAAHQRNPSKLAGLLGKPTLIYELQEALRDEVLQEATVIDRSIEQLPKRYRFLDDLAEQSEEEEGYGLQDHSEDLLMQLAKERWNGGTCIAVAKSEHVCRSFAQMVEASWGQLSDGLRRRMGVSIKDARKLTTIITDADRRDRIPTTQGIVVTTERLLGRTDMRSIRYAACLSPGLNPGTIERLLFRAPTGEAKPSFKIYDYTGELASALGRVL